MVIEDMSFPNWGIKRYIKLYREEILRPLHPDIQGANWNKLRITVFGSFTTDGYAAVGAQLSIGVCSGIDRPFGWTGTGGTRNWVGFQFGNAYGLNFGAGNTWFAQTTSNYMSYKVNGTLTQVGTSDVGRNFATIWTNPRRWFFAVDITKGSPNYTATYYSPTDYMYDPEQFRAMDSFSNANLTPAVILVPEWNVQSSAWVKNQYPIQDAGGNKSLPVSEANGQYDTLSIHWSHATIPVLIFGVAVARLT